MTMAHVLIIEDNRDFADFARAVLELNGHTRGAHRLLA